MNREVSFLAVDLGAASGRVMDCRWDGDRFKLDEIHRFPNGGVRMGAGLHWDVASIWSEIESGLKRFSAGRSQLPAGIGVDAWGVDYGLLDEAGRLLGNPYHYRDARTSGLPAALESTIGARELFRATGVQTMEINTCFQLASMARSGDRQLAEAHTLLMIPDLFAFMLSGARRVEFTEATTTELYNLRGRCWSEETLARLELPRRIFPEVVMPATVLGSVLPAVARNCGFPGGFPTVAVASHDTASAMAAVPGLDDASIFLSSGTWSLMGIAAEEPNLSEEFFQGGFTNEGSAAGGAMLLKNMTGLWIVQECVRMWEAAGVRSSWPEVEEAASQAPGFRSFIDPAAPELQAPADMCAAVRGYCARTGQPAPESVGQMARCIFESLSLAYREVVESLERIAGRRLSTVRIVGGGCLNRFLCQMTADACGREAIAGPVEAAALGNAMVQAVATGHLKSLAEGRSSLERSVQYRSYAPAEGGQWQEAFARYSKIVALGRTPASSSGRA